jgi:hypothetical protein
MSIEDPMGWRDNPSPQTIRERVAYALCTRDTFGDDHFTQLNDDELQELSNLLTFVHSPINYGRGLCTAYIGTLVRHEREARGWDKRTHGPTHFKFRSDIVEFRWPEWLPMADAALGVLMEVPEVAAVLRASNMRDYPMKPPPDPIPPGPRLKPTNPKGSGGPRGGGTKERKVA